MVMKKISIILFLIVLSRIAFAGFYIEFRIKTEEGAIGIMKIWQQDGNSRTQMLMDNPASGQLVGMPNLANLISLRLLGEPEKTFILNEKDKSYFEAPQRQGRGEQESQKDDYMISVIGTEKINGFSCTHFKASRKSGGPRGEMEWWVSKEVAGYQDLGDLETRQFSTRSMYKEMAKNGIEGFPVKMLMGSRNGKMEMELVKAEKVDIPESRFSLAGYSKKDGMPFLPGGMDMEKVRNMSPEDRVKFFQEMQKSRDVLTKEVEKGKKEE